MNTLLEILFCPVHGICSPAVAGPAMLAIEAMVLKREAIERWFIRQHLRIQRSRQLVMFRLWEVESYDPLCESMFRGGEGPYEDMWFEKRFGQEGPE